MSTLQVMKARIASELRRSNIATQIADAITTAVQAYEHKRYKFAETRALTFATVAQQEFYGVADSPLIPKIEKIDYVKLVVDNYPIDLLPGDPSDLETMTFNGTQYGEPTRYAYYGQQIRLAYVPNAIYTVRVGGIIRAAGPASDAETDNPWMVAGERLIRSRAKLELAMHVLKDRTLADTMALAVEEAEGQHKEVASNLMGGDYEVEATSW